MIIYKMENEIKDGIKKRNRHHCIMAMLLQRCSNYDITKEILESMRK
jgi:hypothetical protein